MPRSFVAGLVDSASDHGLVVEISDEVVSAARLATSGEPLAIAVFVRDRRGFELVQDLSRNRWVSTFALVEQLDPQVWLEAVKAGASGVADWSSAPETIIEAIVAAMQGEIRLPIELYRRQIGRIPEPLTRLALAPSEVRWLQALSEGMTLRTMCDVEGLSIRTLQRRLQNLYLRMGVLNRDQAVALAASWGVTEEADLDEGSI